MTDFAARGAGTFSRRFLGALDETARGGKRLPPRETVDLRDCGEQHAAEDLATAGHRVQPRQSMGVMVLGRFDDGEFDVAPQRIVVGDEREIDFDALCTAGSAKRSATPSRLAVSAIFVPMAGRFYWLVVFWTWARSSARLRVRGMRRRSKSRVARLSAG